MLDMKTSDWILVFATLMGPILAVQAQKFIEKLTESRRRKLKIFYSLMATRAARLSGEHVGALNQIDLEFSGSYFLSLLHFQSRKESAIIIAWREYNDKLSENIDKTPERIPEWNRECDNLFIELLLKLSQNFGFSFDKVQLRRGVYSPMAHGEAEALNKAIQNNLLRVLSGDSALNMKIVELPITAESSNRQRDLQERIINAIGEDGTLKVNLIDPRKP